VLVNVNCQYYIAEDSDVLMTMVTLLLNADTQIPTFKFKNHLKLTNFWKFLKLYIAYSSFVM